MLNRSRLHPQAQPTRGRRTPASRKASANFSGRTRIPDLAMRRGTIRSKSNLGPFSPPGFTRTSMGTMSVTVTCD